MPYKIAPYKNGFRVHKLNADDSLGEAMSDKPMTKRQAAAQMRALYAAENKKEGDLSEEDEVKNGDYGEMPMMELAGPCSWEEMDAREQAEEMAEVYGDLNAKMRQMTDHVLFNPAIEDKAQALIDLAKGYADRLAKTKPETEKGWSVDNLKPDPGPKPDPVKEEPHPGLLIWKEADAYRWIAAYSNNRRDDDNPPEIISSESHKEFDQALEKGDWPMPELWLWHVDYPVGITQYHAYDDRTGFPVAAGQFYPGMDWAAEGIIKAGWNGVSHGMPVTEIRRDPADPTIITRHRTKEISFLPEWAAANKLAFNVIKERMMEDKELPPHKREEFVKAFGEDWVAKIEATLDGKSKAADEAKIEKKEAEQPQAPAEPVNEEMLAIMAELVKQNRELKEVVAGLAEEVKGLKDKEAQAAKEKVEETPAYSALWAALKAGSVIGKEETKVDGRSQLAKDAPAETVEQRHPIPLIANILAANDRGQKRFGA